MQRKITQLDRQEILRYLGWKGGALTPQMEQLLSECIQSTLDTIRPAYRYQIFPLEKVQQGIATQRSTAGTDRNFHCPAFRGM